MSGLGVGSRSDERLVPIATAGVFAEAVLGRSNSAEKLDITRFWNWQDSPTPLTPPEIAPVATGTRATAEDLTPGQLGAAGPEHHEPDGAAGAGRRPVCRSSAQSPPRTCSAT